MKRARTEQVHIATLKYLKKRGITESETTFRENFKFEESIEEMAERLSEDNKVAYSDSVALFCSDLVEYFYAFESLLKFVKQHTNNDKYSHLNAVLVPIFVHMYLDLIFANRVNEADEFFYNFAIDDLGVTLQPLAEKLLKVRKAEDLNKFFEIEKIHHNSCSISFNEEEKQLLMKFLQTQNNLLLIKIFNDRLRLSVLDNDCIEDNATLDSFGNTSDEKINIKQSANQGIRITKMQENEKKVMISPPDQPQTGLGSTPCKQTGQITSIESPNFSSNMEIGMLKKIMGKVESLPPQDPKVNIFRFKDPDRQITTAIISNCRQHIATGLEDSSVRLWNIKTGVTGISKTPDPKSKSYVNMSQVHFGCDFKEDVAERTRLLVKKHLSDLNGIQSTVTLQGHSSTVYCTSFTENDSYLLTASEDSTVRLWDLQNLSNKALYFGHNYPVVSLEISKHDMYFATGSMDCTARLWSLERTFPLRFFNGHQQTVQCVDFHPNVNYLASADTTVRLWDINSGKTVRLMTGHWAPVMSLTFSPNGRWLASGGEDSRIRIWDIASGSLWKEFRGHDDSVYSLHFSPDSCLLASCGADSSLKVWNVNGNSIAQSSSANPTGNPHLLSHRTFPGSATLIHTKFAANNLLNCVLLAS